MIYLITGRQDQYEWVDKSKDVEFAKGKDFRNWITGYENKIQLDTETNIVEGMYGWKGHLEGKTKKFVLDLDEDGNRVPSKRECYVVQIGDFEGQDQWIFDVPSLKSAQKSAMLLGFTCENEKLVHNFLFDYGVVKWNFGIDMKNATCTFMMSKATSTGLKVGEDLPAGYNSFAGCVSRYLGIDISKAAQTSFTGEPMTADQIKYAAIDVTLLGPLYPFLQAEVVRWGVENVVTLESSLARSYGDAMCENLYLDPVPWTKNMEWQFQEVDRIELEFYDLMFEYFYEECRELNFIQKDDEYKFNWRSTTKKKALLRKVYPDMPDSCTTVKGYKEYYKVLQDLDDPKIDLRIMSWLTERNYEEIETYFVVNHRDFLETIDIFYPKDKVLMNLKSPDQKLLLFRLINPAIESTDKEVLPKLNHPLSKMMMEYNKVSKMSTSYGQNFLDAISPDGMFRVKNFTQILNTGRSSMSMLQLLPGQKTYRNPFTPNHPVTGVRDDGHKWVVVGADYASQEAVVAAVFCNEKMLLEAIGAGCDFHSTCASLMFPDKWRELGGDPKPMGKPKDPILLKLRGDSKAVSFGLFYGKTAIGLGNSLDIPATTADLIELFEMEYIMYLEANEESYNKFYPNYKSGRNTKGAKHEWIKQEHKAGFFLPEEVTADDLIDRFYDTFPNINSYLKGVADQAVKDQFIKTPDPIGRVRRFPYPEHSGDESAIKRAAMNMPIQGASANMTKWAICLLKNYIEENDLSHKMKFCLPLHDEVRYICHEEFADEALKIIIDKMEEAAELILGNRLLKAEGEITDVWEK